MDTKPELKHYFELPLAIVMLSTAPILIRYTNIHPLSLIAYRLLFVAGILFILGFIKKQKFKMNKERFKIALVSSILLLHFITWINAIRNLPISVATIIYSCHPVTTAIMGRMILKEAYYKRYFIGLILSLIGMYFVSLTKNNQMEITQYGLINVILSAFFYSLYMVLSKRIRRGLDNTEYSFYLNLFSALFSFCIILIGQLIFNYQINFIHFEVKDWFVILSLTIMPSLLGHTLMVYLVHYFNLNWLSIFKLASPILSSIMAYLLFNEILTITHGIAFTFILIGLVISSNLGDIYAKRSRVNQ